VVSTIGLFQSSAGLLRFIQTSAGALNSITGWRLREMEAPSKSTILKRVLAESESRLKAVLEIRCPNCGVAGIKAGSRKTRQGRIQRLYCRSCRRQFSDSAIPRKQHAPPIILEAVTAYNLGRTLQDTQRHISTRFRRTVPVNTIHSWLKHFASICTFGRFRKRYSFSEDEIIQSRTFSPAREHARLISRSGRAQ
jgi:transposase-like protein